jgi:hypothetical protein
MAEGDLHGIDDEQARVCQVACFDTIVVNTAKLIEKRSDSWNFYQLYKEWRRYMPDETKGKKALGAIDDLRAKLDWLEHYRHTKAAHQTKDDKVTTFTVLPPDIDFLSDVVRVMDMFVDGKIPYALYLGESGQQLDLRKELCL